MPGSGISNAINLRIPVRPDAGSVARRAISAWMGNHPRIDDALLAISELVNNAVVHGGLGDSEELTVEMTPGEDAVRITVRHVGALFEVGQVSPLSSQEAPVSRGLAIVGQVADSWGVDSDGAEVTTWFELSPGMSGLESI